MAIGLLVGGRTRRSASQQVPSARLIALKPLRDRKASEDRFCCTAHGDRRLRRVGDQPAEKISASMVECAVSLIVADGRFSACGELG